MATNIHDLLDTAAAFCNLAENETNRDAGKLERAAQYAAIAQAHAATAQAMTFAKSEQLQNDLDDCNAFRAAAEKAAEDRLREIARLRSAIF